LSIPIKRENEVVGVINLENRAKMPQYLASGLGDAPGGPRRHCHRQRRSRRVKRANDAKGRFVSEVAHELA
jgi:hypothetical protein